MSACELYVIRANGLVELAGEVRNPHGWCPAFWDSFAEQFGIGKRFPTVGECLWRTRRGRMNITKHATCLDGKPHWEIDS